MAYLKPQSLFKIRFKLKSKLGCLKTSLLAGLHAATAVWKIVTAPKQNHELKSGLSGIQCLHWVLKLA